MFILTNIIDCFWMEIKEKMQEESRILYVALTRTIRKLVWFKDLDSDVEDCWANYMEVSE